MASNKITGYEQTLINCLHELNSKMEELTSDDMMNEEAYRLLSEEQMKQHQLIKDVIQGVRVICQSTYYTKRVSNQTSQNQKRLSEKEKRLQYANHPELFHLCQSCDSIFTCKENLARHKAKTIKCGIVKNCKKGALEFGVVRSDAINDFILEHIDDADSGGEDNDVAV